MYLSVLQLHFASGHLAGLEWGTEQFWEHRAVITPKPETAEAATETCECLLQPWVSFFNFASIVKLVVSAMNFSWADAQGVLPSQATTWPSWLLHVWEAWQALEELGTSFDNYWESPAIFPSSPSNLRLQLPSPGHSKLCPGTPAHLTWPPWQCDLHGPPGSQQSDKDISYAQCALCSGVGGRQVEYEGRKNSYCDLTVYQTYKSWVFKAILAIIFSHFFKSVILNSIFHAYNALHLILHKCLQLWHKNACSVIIFMVKFSETQMFREIKSKAYGSSWAESFMNFNNFSLILK